MVMNENRGGDAHLEIGVEDQVDIVIERVEVVIRL